MKSVLGSENITNVMSKHLGSAFSFLLRDSNGKIKQRLRDKNIMSSLYYICSMYYVKVLEAER